MKKLHTYFLGLGFLLSAGASAQQSNPDQNPNYQVSMDYYMQNYRTLTANEGETVQSTYTAYDWTTHKMEQKQERKDRKYELQKMRYQSRYRCSYGTSPYYYGGGSFNNPYYNPFWYGAGIYSFIF